MRSKRAIFPLFFLLTIVIAACTEAVEFVDPDAELADTSPSAAAINAAANQAATGQAAEQATAADATAINGDVLADATETMAADGEATAAPAETAAPESSSTTATTELLSTKSPQINRRVEVPDNLRVNWLIPWDGIRPIYDPEFVPAGDAPLEHDELIIGVAWDGEAKAYPITVLRSREMVNDELAGIPTLVTWWPICYTGLVHDRRIDGNAHTFGNAGGLMMNAMTWWDHETESIWSQPWGRSIEGPYKGTELFLLPSQITTWGSWRTEHPETLAMTNDSFRIGFKQKFNPDFVIGLILADQAKAFYYRDVAAAGVVNDAIGEFPIFVWAASENFHAYIRQAAGQTLTFRLEGDLLLDNETDSTWDISRGLATAGPLKGVSLQPIPSSSAFDWAWEDFFPGTEFYSG